MEAHLPGAQGGHGSQPARSYHHHRIEVIQSKEVVLLFTLRKNIIEWKIGLEAEASIVKIICYNSCFPANVSLRRGVNFEMPELKVQVYKSLI